MVRVIIDSSNRLVVDIIQEKKGLMRLHPILN
jgi:hypothetical protein